MDASEYLAWEREQAERLTLAEQFEIEVDRIYLRIFELPES